MNNDFELPKWQKIDLHIHSPYSCIKKGENEMKAYYLNKKIDNALSFDEKVEYWKEDLYLAIHNNELDIISIADHNHFSSNLFKNIKEMMINNNSKCEIFPAAELDVSFEGQIIHFVVIFNKDLSNDKLDYLEKLILEIYKENTNILLEKLIQKFIKFEYVFIPHSEKKDNGIQITDENREKIENLIKNMIIPSLEGNEKMANQYYKNMRDSMDAFENFGIPTFVAFSDNHNILNYEPKTFTYIKTNKTFNGLKISLISSKRLLIQKNKPIENFKDKVKYVEFKLKYNKREDTFTNKIFLSENLTSIIGNRSTGKSLILHALFDKDGKKNKTGQYFGKQGTKTPIFKKEREIKFFNFNNKEYDKNWVTNNVKFYQQDELINAFFSSDIYKDYQYLFNTEYDESFNSQKDKIKKYILSIYDYSKELIEVSESSPFKFQELVPEIRKKFLMTIDISAMKKDVDDNISKIAKFIDDIKNLLGSSKLLMITNEEKITLNNMQNRFISLKNEYYYKKKFYNSFEDSQKLFFSKNSNNYIEKIINDILVMKKNYKEIEKCIYNTKETILKYENIYSFGKNKKYKFQKEYMIGINSELVENILNDNNKNLIDSNKDVFYYAKNICSMAREEWEKWVADNIIIKHNIIYNNNNIIENISEMSEGRQALAIIEVLLSEETRNCNILVIDQPEDNVDNNDIYHIICRQLLQHSNKQIIFSTHSANIVVNGDSEVVAFTEKNNGNLVIKEYILEDNECYEKICSILEGGKIAFDKRGMRYDIR